MKILAGFLIAAPLWAAACSEDPQYVQAPLGIEVGTGNPDDTGMASERVILPIDAAKLADPDVVQERQDLADRLGIDVGEVSELRLDHVSLSVEWTIKNLSPDPGNDPFNPLANLPDGTCSAAELLWSRAQPSERAANQDLRDVCSALGVNIARMNF